MSRLTTAVALFAILAAPVLPITVGTSIANAATPPHYNVARAFCGDHAYGSPHRDCIADADDDTGRFAVRNHGGHRIALRTQAAIVRYLSKHATPCVEEDSNACFWNASSRGNGVGESFVTVGDGHENTDRTLPQYHTPTVLYVNLFG